MEEAAVGTVAAAQSGFDRAEKKIRTVTAHHQQVLLNLAPSSTRAGPLCRPTRHESDQHARYSIIEGSIHDACCMDGCYVRAIFSSSIELSSHQDALLRTNGSSAVRPHHCKNMTLSRLREFARLC